MEGEQEGVRLSYSTPRPKILALVYGWPWLQPPSGGSLRLQDVVSGLSSAGSLEVACYVDREPARLSDAVVEERDVVVQELPLRDPGSPWRYLRLALSGRPTELAAIDHTRVQRNAVGDSVYDICYVSHPFLFEMCPKGAASILDLYDLPGDLIRTDVAVRTGTARRSVRSFARLINARAWDRTLRRMASRATVTTFCSDVDLRRVGARRPALIPNGYPDPVEEPLEVTEGETLLFAGTMTHPPNVQGLEFFVAEILPIIREHRPNTTLCIAGRAAERFQPKNVTGVRIVSDPEDMAPILRSSCGAVVPLLSGSGTRVKILEAFAHGVPVVSTALGAAGLEVRDGQHLLIGDSPEQFAGHCVRLLSDPALRQRLASTARTLFESRYASPTVQASWGALVRRLAEEVT